MTHFSFARPRGGARPAARQLGPVTHAIRSLRPNEAPTWELRQAQIDAEERAALRDLRTRIKAQMDADFNRIDRCLTILDAMDGDSDIEQDVGEMAEGLNEDGSDEDHGELTLGWAANVGQLGLGDNTADGDATALETYGAGFGRSGHEDDEDSHDREGDPAERGIGDMDGAIEQFGRAVGQNSVFA